jgi:hypothetical protein
MSEIIGARRAPSQGDYIHRHNQVANTVHLNWLPNVDCQRDHQFRIANMSHCTRHNLRETYQKCSDQWTKRIGPHKVAKLMGLFEQRSLNKILFFFPKAKDRLAKRLQMCLIKWQSECDSSNKGALTKSFFSKSKRQTSQKTANVPTFINDSNRSREIEGISTQI